ncbi:DUF4139 domain-containing protein [Streptacidiphilus sp. N1-12]|uniref:DUF4139 domain-containing protein n=2 Tax=Streptacidiphilus alkalitolerans TaxID=3342712 RepID=A0ABV6WJ99_9ACTN
MTATDRQLTSVLHSVVVYAAGALCRRRAVLTLPPGPAGPLRVRLDGLPLTADAHSLRGSLRSGPDGLRILDVRRVVRAELSAVEDLSPLRRDCDAAEEELYAAGAARAALAAQVEHIAALRAVPPTPRRGDPPRRAPAAALLALADFVDSRLAELQQRLLAAEDALREAEQRAEIARRRLRAASAGQPVEQVAGTTSVLLTLDQTAPLTTGAEVELELEYGVPGATWTPTYQLRLDGIDGDRPTGRLFMRACVAQRSGEDWTGVRIGLSTADLRRRTDLPELRSLRIGRKQDEPAPQLWREPPAGLAELFDGYDDFLGPAVRQQEMSALSRRAVGAAGGFGGGPVPPPVPFPPAVSMPMAPTPVASMPPPPPAPGGGGYGAMAPQAAEPDRSRSLPKTAKAVRASSAPAAAEPAAPAAPPQPPAPDPALRDYAQLALAGAGPEEPREERGRLRPAAPPPGALAAEQRRQAEAVTRLPLPPHCRPVRASAGSFDHRYDAGAPVDVPSDGAWHTVPVLEFPVEAVPEHICVPAVDPRVYAAVRLGNTSTHALLAGAAEVSVDGAHLMTVQLPTLAPGEHRRVGIGVVESIQVARRVQSRESSAGLRGGTTVITQGIEIDLANRLGRPVTVEVRERVPVSDDRDVRVEEQPATPPWTAVPPEQDETHRRGMRVWRVTLAPHARQRLNGGYEIRVPVAKALFDGNRRL